MTHKGGISVALTIASRELDGVTVLDLSGRITLGEGSVQLREAIRDLISKGSKNILLNLGDVNYIDSSGLGELVGAYTTAKNQGAALKLLSLTRKVKDVLQLTKLYTVFDIYDDEASAIASYKYPACQLVPNCAAAQRESQVAILAPRIARFQSGRPRRSSFQNFRAILTGWSFCFSAQLGCPLAQWWVPYRGTSSASRLG
jgi:anti-sigma B factor antagonist